MSREEDFIERNKGWIINVIKEEVRNDPSGAKKLLKKFMKNGFNIK